MVQAAIHSTSKVDRSTAVRMATVAWILTSVYYFYQYALRSAPAVMMPYTIIKEANPPQFGGTATGVVNFLNFTFSALLGPVFGWMLLNVAGGAKQIQLSHYQSAFLPLLYGVAIAILLTLALKETGPAAHAATNSSKEN